MSIKTRYLQLSDTTMMEYCMKEHASDKLFTNGEITPESPVNSAFIMTKLLDGHYAYFTVASAEVEYNPDSKKYEKKKMNLRNAGESNILSTINTINHLAVPQDKNDSYWYTFLDNDYEYCDSYSINNVLPESIKYKEYSPYCECPYKKGYMVLGSNGEFIRKEFNDSIYTNTNSDININSLNDDHFLFNNLKQSTTFPGWDTVRLYFVSGYDFSDMYGAMLRISVQRNDKSTLDLCNFFYTKSNVYKHIKFLVKPIIFGNFIYDKCIEINVPSIGSLNSESKLMYSVLDPEEEIQYDTLKDLLNVDLNSNIRLSFSYVDSDNKELKNIEYSLNEKILNKVSNKDVCCEFARTSTISGSIPTQQINSDKLGVYIALNNDYPYIEFYGTWESEALNFKTVQSFNGPIQLYNSSLVKKDSTYLVDKDYVPEYDMEKWVAMHEIECIFVNTKNEILKQETYNLSQTFISDTNEITKFYYRPIYFDEIHQGDSLGDVVMILHYTMRFLNIEDSVQFIKSGSLTVEGEDINRFWGKGAKLPFADTLSYKVYNKIVENKQSLSNNTGLTPQTKYIKVFYNVSNIVLDTSGGAVGNGNYTLLISKAPRNYKFVFKQRDINGNNKYVDLTDSYYKLYAKDANGNDIVIDPTYSSNMNLMLGELEFNIPPAAINRLYQVPRADRYISILAYNTDNSTSSLYDMRYTF